MRHRRWRGRVQCVSEFWKSEPWLRSSWGKEMLLNLFYSRIKYMTWQLWNEIICILLISSSTFSIIFSLRIIGSQLRLSAFGQEQYSCSSTVNVLGWDRAHLSLHYVAYDHPLLAPNASVIYINLSFPIYVFPWLLWLNMQTKYSFLNWNISQVEKISKFDLRCDVQWTIVVFVRVGAFPA